MSPTTYRRAMDNKAEVSDFLSSRRARIRPQDAGLPLYGGKRRVPGLRREEVALLAGVSVDYYVRLERGNLSGVSDSVLDALARALKLDESEQAHLVDLARAANRAHRPQRRPARPTVRPGVQLVLDSIGAPAYVRNARMDVLAANALGFALYSEVFAPDTLPVNMLRFVFLDPAAPDFFLDWEKVASESVASLRTAAGRDPYDRALTDLVGELSTHSEPFRTWWAAHQVRLHKTRTKRLHHPVVGELELTGEALTMAADEGLTVITYTVEPASPSAEALAFLASWAADGTHERSGRTP